jgi:hypothetical protein
MNYHEGMIEWTDKFGVEHRIGSGEAKYVLRVLYENFPGGIDDVLSKSSKIEWRDSDGVYHTMSDMYAIEFLAEFFEEWPGGFSEIEACIAERDKRINELETQLGLVNKNDDLHDLLDNYREETACQVYNGWVRYRKPEELREDINFAIAELEAKANK